jgi:hypothetical protein
LRSSKLNAPNKVKWLICNDSWKLYHTSAFKA